MRSEADCGVQDNLVPASDLYWNFTGLVKKVVPPPPPDGEHQFPLPEEDTEGQRAQPLLELQPYHRNYNTVASTATGAPSWRSSNPTRIPYFATLPDPVLLFCRHRLSRVRLRSTQGDKAPVAGGGSCLAIDGAQ